MQNDTKVLSRSAVFIALMMIGAQISIPLPSLVPISLQTLAIYMCALMCEKKHALLITLVYVFMGAIGLPVFAGFTGGASHVFGPAGGFIFGFPVMAFIVSRIAYQSEDVKGCESLERSDACWHYCALCHWYALLYVCYKKQYDHCIIKLCSAIYPR